VTYLGTGKPFIIRVRVERVAKVVRSWQDGKIKEWEEKK